MRLSLCGSGHPEGTGPQILTVGVQGEHLGLDALFVAGLFDETTGQRRVFPVCDHPADRVAAEDVEHDVEVEVRPLGRPQQLGGGSDRSALSPFERWVSPARPPVGSGTGAPVVGSGGCETVRYLV